MSRPTPRRPKPGRNNISRQISAKLRALHITDEPRFHVEKRRNTDPNPYSPEVTYVRKVRIVLGPGNTFVNLGMVLTAIWPSRGEFEPFRRMMIVGISAFGEAGAKTYVSVETLAGLFQGKSDADRRWTDYGVQGSRRPAIHLRAAPKDLAWVTASDGNLIFIATNPDGSVILDLLVHLTGSDSQDSELNFVKSRENESRAQQHRYRQQQQQIPEASPRGRKGPDRVV